MWFIHIYISGRFIFHQVHVEINQLMLHLISYDQFINVLEKKLRYFNARVLNFLNLNMEASEHK